MAYEFKKGVVTKALLAALVIVGGGYAQAQQLSVDSTQLVVNTAQASTGFTFPYQGATLVYRRFYAREWQEFFKGNVTQIFVPGGATTEVINGPLPNRVEVKQVDQNHPSVFVTDDAVFVDSGPTSNFFKVTRPSTAAVERVAAAKVGLYWVVSIKSNDGKGATFITTDDRYNDVFLVKDEFIEDQTELKLLGRGEIYDRLYREKKAIELEFYKQRYALQKKAELENSELKKTELIKDEALTIQSTPKVPDYLSTSARYGIAREGKKSVAVFIKSTGELVKIIDHPFEIQSAQFQGGSLVIESARARFIYSAVDLRYVFHQSKASIAYKGAVLQCEEVFRH